MSTAVGKKEHLYKILVIGELGTGKTSFIKRYVHQFFSSNYRATIGVDFALKVIPWDPSTLVRLQLWDIAGQERFGNMTRWVSECSGVNNSAKLIPCDSPGFITRKPLAHL